MKTMEQFYNEIIANKELKEAAEKAITEKRLAEFLTKQEVDGTAEEFEAFVKEKKCESRELSDEELGAVAGGYDWGRRIDYREESSINDSSYDFNVGDYVYAYDGWFFGYSTKKVKILSRTTKKVRLRDFEKMQKSDFYRPAYLVKYDDGKTDIIEQQMLAKM